jgi:hypothetical protein
MAKNENAHEKQLEKQLQKDTVYLSIEEQIAQFVEIIIDIYLQQQPHEE